jgi:hypothetical protein
MYLVEDTYHFPHNKRDAHAGFLQNPQEPSFPVGRGELEPGLSVVQYQRGVWRSVFQLLLVLVIKLPPITVCSLLIALNRFYHHSGTPYSHLQGSIVWTLRL